MILGKANVNVLPTIMLAAWLGISDEAKSVGGRKAVSSGRPISLVAFRRE